MELRYCSLAHGDHHDGLCAWCGSLLPPLRRRWCSDACSVAWRDNHVWSFARAAALSRDDGRCRVCADPEDLEVHHDPPVGRRGYGQGCQHHLAKLRTLCSLHHLEAHDVLRSAPGAQLALFRAA